MEENKENKEKISINLATEMLKEKLINTIEESGLPIANVFLVWKLLTSDIESAYYSVINAERPEKEHKVEINSLDVE